MSDLVDSIIILIRTSRMKEAIEDWAMASGKTKGLARKECHNVREVLRGKYARRKAKKGTKGKSD